MGSRVQPEATEASGGCVVIEVAAGVHLSVADVRVLLDVLDAAAVHADPGPRAAHVIRQLRKSVERLTHTTRNAQSSVTFDPESVQHAAYDLVDTAEAAAILGITPGGVRYLADAGRIPAHRAGGRWLYPARAVVHRAERQAARRSG